MTQFCYSLFTIPVTRCCRNKLRHGNNGSSVFTVPAGIRGTTAVVQGRVGANSDARLHRGLHDNVHSAVTLPTSAGVLTGGRVELSLVLRL